MININNIELKNGKFLQIKDFNEPFQKFLKATKCKGLPIDWVAEGVKTDGIRFKNKRKRMFVIVSAAKESDDKDWLHVSVSKKGGAPSWYDMKIIKDLFVGGNRKAIIVFPEEKNYVNIAEVLHLWCCLDGDNIPEFSGYLPGVKGPTI